MTLKYRGGDGRYLIGIPDTDLEDEDVKRLAEDRGITPAAFRKELLESGLYSEKKDTKGGSDE